MSDRKISDRKKEHLDLASGASSQTSMTAGWEDVRLIPRSLPEVSMVDIDLSIELVSQRLAAPLMIASMTGGHDAALSINESLASAAEEFGLAIGAGSQRAALRRPELAPTYSVLRQAAPEAVIFANVGVCQLVAQRDEPPLGQSDIETIVEMIDAQFLIVHINILEEIIQPEGDENTSHLLAAIEQVVRWSSVPVLAKETGAGMEASTARALMDVGVAAVDVGGVGGTSFARIEGLRAEGQGDDRRARVGRTFDGWGIPTVMSVMETAPVGLPVIATGGIRNGLHVAKAVSLGAAAAGIGRPALSAALEGYEALTRELHTFLHELKIAMLLTGSSDVDALRHSEHVIVGDAMEWKQQRAGVP